MASVTSDPIRFGYGSGEAFWSWIAVCEDLLIQLVSYVLLLGCSIADDSGLLLWKGCCHIGGLTVDIMVWLDGLHDTESSSQYLPY